jgi:LPXTG-motif cell wall-anchored protein
VGGEPGTRRIRVSALLGVVAATLVLDQVTVGSARVSTGDASLLVLATAGIVVLVAAIAGMVAGRRPDEND